MAVKRNSLGKGLDSLIPIAQTESKTNKEKKDSLEKEEKGTQETIV